MPLHEAKTITGLPWSHSCFVEAIGGGSCQPRTNLNAGGTPATTGSPPLTHLLRERTLRAIRIISHAKVFVNLEQTLLMRDRFRERTPTRIVAKQSRGRGFQSAIRQMRRQSRVFRPKIGIFREPEWKKHVGQNLRDTGFADQRRRFWRCLSGQRVMKFPKGMIEPAEEIICRNATPFT